MHAGKNHAKRKYIFENIFPFTLQSRELNSQHINYREMFQTLVSQSCRSDVSVNTERMCLDVGGVCGVNREFKQKRRGQRRQLRQNNKTNYTTRICERLTFVPPCSRVRRQLLYFIHVVCKTWSIFQELTSIFSFRKRRWKQLKFSENRNKQGNQSKYMPRKTQIMSKYFYCFPMLSSSSSFAWTRSLLARSLKQSFIIQ